MLPAPDEGTANHEAGHGVAGHALGFRVHRLSLIPCEVPGGWFVGHCTLRPRPTAAALAACRETAERFILYRMAGPAAEELFCPHPDPDALAHATEYEQGDIGNVARWLRAHAPGSVEAYRADLWERTLALLKPRRVAVESVAAALLARRELDRAGFLAALPPPPTRGTIPRLFLGR